MAMLKCLPIPKGSNTLNEATSCARVRETPRTHAEQAWSMRLAIAEICFELASRNSPLFGQDIILIALLRTGATPTQYPRA